MLRKITSLIAACLATVVVFGQTSLLQHLASYNTNVTESAEVVAYDPASKRVFFTSNAPNKLTILDIQNPASPVLVQDISLATYGGGPNSVAVANGIVAIAVQAVNPVNAGKVVFLDTNGVYIHDVTVGVLPDMLTFSPDGTKVLTANEAQPSDDYTIDPEGSVSVIDISAGVVNATVNTISFTSLNNRKQHLINKGVRIYGNNGAATVAQDLEPEYITFSPDSAKIYVNCQENNAMLVIDMATYQILDVLPYGYKDHLRGRPSLQTYNINTLIPNWPALGTPVYDGGQPTVYLGGFSGLYFDAIESTPAELIFYTVPDRGPNDEPITRTSVTPVAPKSLRPYKLPDYQSRIVRFSINAITGAITLQQILLHRQDGVTPISGKGNIPGFDEVPVTYADSNTAFASVDFTANSGGETFHQLPYDAFGGDMEGIVRDNAGNFWICDENRPALYKFDTTGKLIERYVPNGTSLLGSTPQAVGFYGAETLPAVYAKRWANRGFEAIAYDNTTDIVYAFIQSPLENPNTSTRNNSDVIRILGINATTGIPVREYIYLLERNKYSGYSADRTDKIGDAVYIGNNKFLVIERDSKGANEREGKKYIFEISLVGATNIAGQAISSDTLELMTADQLVAMGVNPVHKILRTNLPSIGYTPSDKAEGIALLPNGDIAVLNDNDFGLAGAGVTDNSVLGIIHFNNDNTLDASNQDGGINIKAHPVLGMYQPDAIASYQVNGKTYIVTANEGDSRDYSGFSEDTRVKDIALDSTAYPNAATLQQSAETGRLKTTDATGDFDDDGDFDQIYTYGARSFSIFDQYGNLVFDSGNEFEVKVKDTEPTLFNEDDGTFDGRSDDKGVEPEAIAVGKIDSFVYAFVGLERQSAIIVYDITNPIQPQFVAYYNNRTTTQGDVSPEIIRFVPAAQSPNGENLLIVGYEISGSVGIIQVGGVVATSKALRDEVKFQAFPNPVNDVLNFDQLLTGQVIDANGRIIDTFTNTNQIRTSDWAAGMYYIRTVDKGTRPVLKM